MNIVSNFRRCHREQNSVTINLFDIFVIQKIVKISINTNENIKTNINLGSFIFFSQVKTFCWKVLGNFKFYFLFNVSVLSQLVMPWHHYIDKKNFFFIKWFSSISLLKRKLWNGIRYLRSLEDIHFEAIWAQNSAFWSMSVSLSFFVSFVLCSPNERKAIFIKFDY